MKRKCRTMSHQVRIPTATCCKNQFEWHCLSHVPNISQHFPTCPNYLGLGMAAEQEEIAVVGLGSEDYGGVIDHSFSQQLLAKHEGLMVICTGFNDD